MIKTNSIFQAYFISDASYLCTIVFSCLVLFSRGLLAEPSSYELVSDEQQGVAQRLGISSSVVAEAVEQDAREFTIQKESVDISFDPNGSKFLENAYRVDKAIPLNRKTKAALRTLRELRKKKEKEQKEVERKLALERLEFRRNVEDAMGKILSFEPISSRAAHQVGEVGPNEEYSKTRPVGVVALTARDRLISNLYSDKEDNGSSAVNNLENRPVETGITSSERANHSQEGTFIRESSLAHMRNFQRHSPANNRSQEGVVQVESRQAPPVRSEKKDGAQSHSNIPLKPIYTNEMGSE